MAEDPERTAELARQLTEYLGGERKVFELELAPEGGELSQEVWRELLAIPRGETRTYGEIAKSSAARAPPARWGAPTPPTRSR